MFQGEHSEIVPIFPLRHEFFSLEIAKLFSSQRDLSKIGRTFTRQGISLLQGPLWVCSCRDQTETIVFVESHERRRNAHQRTSLFLTILCLSLELPLFEIGLTAWACVGTEVRFSGFELLA